MYMDPQFLLNIDDYFFEKRPSKIIKTIVVTLGSKIVHNFSTV